MKIASRVAQPTEPRTITDPPCWIDEMGRCRDVSDLPQRDQDWLALGGRGGETAGLLAARLVAARDRSEQAMNQTAGALIKVRERREQYPDEPLPPAWVARLGDLVVAELESLWIADDVAHTVALACPSWVGLPVGERPIDPGEVSWARVSRLIAREVQLIAGLGLPDEDYDRLCALDAMRDCAEGDAEAVRERGREAIRTAVRLRHGSGAACALPRGRDLLGGTP